MNPMVYPAIAGFAVLVVGFALGMLIQKVRAARRVKDADAYAERVRTEAEREAKTMRKEALLEAKEVIYQAQKDFEHETKERRSEVLEIERRLAKKEEISTRRWSCWRREIRTCADRKRRSKRRGTCSPPGRPKPSASLSAR